MSNFIKEIKSTLKGVKKMSNYLKVTIIDEYGGEDLENYTDEEIEGMDAKKKDAPSTTSSEGGFNHVYSDVHEKKKQDDHIDTEKETGDQRYDDNEDYPYNKQDR